MVEGQIRSPGQGQIKSCQGKVKAGQGQGRSRSRQVKVKAGQGQVRLRSSPVKIWSCQVTSHQGQVKARSRSRLSQEKKNGAILFLDPKNIVLDTKIIILCALDQKL